VHPAVLRLGIDFGTSNTAAVLGYPDGQIRSLLFDGSPSLPSAVCRDPAGTLLVGRDATYAARANPERYEPNPKRRIDEHAVLLGDAEVPVVDLIAGVLGRVATEARRVAGNAPIAVTITYPAAWAQTRRAILVSAAERAGLRGTVLVPEPIAAATSFVEVVGGAVPPGQSVVVYDLGAGTFDATVVRRGQNGFEVLAAEGLAQGGGLDIDAAIVGYLGAVHGGRHPEEWARLTRPTTPADRRVHRLLWDDVRSAKEMLSRTTSTVINVPLTNEDVLLARTQLEELARPLLENTIAATRAALAAARVAPGDVAGIFLVGGGSRIPLVATMLHQTLGRPPTVVESPELVVAQGSVRTVGTLSVAFGGGPAAGPAPQYGPATSASGYPTGQHTAASGYVTGAPTSGVPGPATPPWGGAPVSAVPGVASGPPHPGWQVQQHPRGPVMPPAGPSGPGAPRPAGRTSKALIAFVAVAAVLICGGLIAGIVSLLPDDDKDGSNRTSTPPGRTASGVTWDTNATEFGGADVGTRIAYDCPSAGRAGTVWGSDVYTADSSVCTAAVHAGKTTFANGGSVVIEMQPGGSNFQGSTRNGVTTRAWPQYFGDTFKFV
jgi:actin-like ATPase involved in cell morphogenesis